MSLRAAIRRGRTGQRVELASLTKDDGTAYWVVPQKFTTEVADRIQVELLALRDLVGPAAGLDPDNPDPGKLAELMRAATAQQFEALRRLSVLRLREGIADHNFDDDDGQPIDGVTDELLEAILEFPPLVDELTRVVGAFNAPLERTSVTSSRK